MLHLNEKIDLIAKGLKEVYHGTFGNFEDFDSKLLGTNTHAHSATLGFFFASNVMVATSYASVIREELEGLVARKASLKAEVVKKTGGEEYQETVHKLIQKVFNKKETYTDEMWSELEPIMDSVVDIDRKIAELSDVYFNDQIDLSENGKIKKVFLQIDKPFVLEYEGNPITKGELSLSSIIETAKVNGFDSVIIKSTLDGGDPCGHTELTDIYIVFKSEQILKEARSYGLDDLTKIMNELEKQVFAEQAFIRVNEKRFESNAEQGWSELKSEADEHLKIWDNLKIKRDIAKQKTRGLRI